MLTIEGLISVLGLCLTCFGLGYAIGSKDNNKPQKQPPLVWKTLRLFLQVIKRTSRLSAVPLCKYILADLCGIVKSSRAFR